MVLFQNLSTTLRKQRLGGNSGALAYGEWGRKPTSFTCCCSRQSRLPCIIWPRNSDSDGTEYQESAEIGQTWASRKFRNQSHN